MPYLTTSLSLIEYMTVYDLANKKMTTISNERINLLKNLKNSLNGVVAGGWKWRWAFSLITAKMRLPSVSAEIHLRHGHFFCFNYTRGSKKRAISFSGCVKVFKKLFANKLRHRPLRSNLHRWMENWRSVYAAFTEKSEVVLSELE